MGQVSWEGGSGDWFDPAHWDIGVAPATADNANIAASGTYTVTLRAPATAASLTITTVSATLDIADPGGTETITGGLSNAGIVEIDAAFVGGTVVWIGGSLGNDGRVTIGNGTILAPTTVSAANLTNSGMIDITGGASQQTA